MLGIGRLPEGVQRASVRALLTLPYGVLRGVVGRAVLLDGQRLDIEAQLALRLLEWVGTSDLETLSVADARTRVARDVRTFAGALVRRVAIEDVAVGGGDGSLRARLYVPEQPVIDGVGDRLDPLLVFFHGGGFVVCDLDTHDNPCRFIASHAGVRVLSVEYRRAPEAMFPAAADDALAAFRDVVRRAGEWGVDPARVGVGGDSAGGNLAAGVALCCAREGHLAPAFQLLVYPWLDLSRKRRSYELFGRGFYLTESDLDWYKHQYVGGREDALDVRCSPLLAEDLGGVAPAYVATAGFDPLRDEGEEYAARLAAAGVPVALRRHAGLVHGFLNTVGSGRVAGEALLEAAGALRVGLAARAWRASGSADAGG